MASPGLEVKTARCEALRWKSMFIETEEGPAAPESSDGSNFWCVYTQNCLGPDGEVVGNGTCTPSRSCYHAL